MNTIKRIFTVIALLSCGAAVHATELKKPAAPAGNLPAGKRAPAVQGAATGNLPGNMQGAQQGQMGRQASQARQAGQIGQQMNDLHQMEGLGAGGGLNPQANQGRRSGGGLGDIGARQNPSGGLGGFGASTREAGGTTPGQSDFVVPGSVRTGSGDTGQRGGTGGNTTGGGVQIYDARGQNAPPQLYTTGGGSNPNAGSNTNRGGNTNASNNNASPPKNNNEGGKNDKEKKEKENVGKNENAGKPDKPDKPEKMSGMPTDETRGGGATRPAFTRSSSAGPGGRGSQEGNTSGSPGPQLRVQGIAGGPEARGAAAPRDLSRERFGGPGARPGETGIPR